MAGLRVIRASLMSDGTAFADAMAGGAWRSRVLVLKRDGATAVYRTRVRDRDVVVKCWAMGTRARLQALIGGTRGLRHWRGAARLRKCGIATAWTWALLRGNEGGKAMEYLVMEALPGKSVLGHLADDDLSVREQHALAATIGRQVSILSRHLLYNRDHKPSNLIVRSDRADGPTVAVIDCVAIHRGLRPDRMLAALVLEPLGVGLLPRRALMMRVVRECARDAPDILDGGERRWRREVWRRVRAMVEAHGDPTPRVNPLA